MNDESKKSVVSPCDGTCRLSSRTDLCEGCFRTPAEIGRWASTNDRDRQDILGLIAERRGPQGTIEPDSRPGRETND
ncbi:MAG: putative Fe-S protein YdhL (DUF1289 family) [Hyphomicrobiaceae bacterium]|jgi:predicted Fe-S protein YdhL (DUF1289 family)